MTCEPLVERIDCESESAAFELEKLLIAEIGRRDLGLGPLVNLTNGGDGSSGAIQSLEARAKKSAAMRGRSLSAEHVAKFRGRVFSLETRMKISGALRGRKIPKESIAKAAAARRGRKLSPEHVSKMVASRVGKPLSAEHRAKLRKPKAPRSEWHSAKISAALTGKKYGRRSAETRARMVEAWKKRREKFGPTGRPVVSATAQILQENDSCM